MGLDMYLYARRYSAKYVNEEDHAKLLALKLPFPGEPETFEVLAQVAYWRKVNAVHHWFVTNAAAGEDNCQPVHLDIETLRTLRDICVDLLEKRDPKEAAARLPTSDGFMFGNTDYDALYWAGVEDTAKQLGAILVWDELRAHALGRQYSDVDYTYQASW